MQAYPQAFAQASKGTLVPGQSITVNKYTVVVERYLSQGGFAHVYLVRTAQPVYNTTHHVLKRIAVPNEAMLSEVKKEVDIMRILKGHPNIVFLIDAAWHRMANGTYEVFILMEFCPGGGIIDMMNRRLRERLTEAEILTIFVEVSEGLAAMHALKPPILHRDLKVENILQASPASYKLCDFGSAIPVQKVPASTQELRTLEADLNRHTTLQYRAPEMIDVHLRRPIDEKSDVWALGVLLYKLCYYTTPFEEHGPLAILNVQYKIPPYPVYSSQMNSLIASMLKEHGAQRPSIFDILQHVHSLRGSTSRFTYNIPYKEPLSPRSLQAPLQALSPNIATSPLDDLVSYKSPQSEGKNAGIEAREKVLEAIAPMRRGRPQSHGPKSSSRNTSPEKPVSFETKFGGEHNHAWKGLHVSKSGVPSSGIDSASLSSKVDADAWSIASRQSGQKPDVADRRTVEDSFSSGFGSKFVPSSSRSPHASRPTEGIPSAQFSGFGDAFDPSKSNAALSQDSRSPQTTQSQSRSRQSRFINKDAFDGLGLSAQPQAPTLGEARMSRTGLASFGSSSTSPSTPYTLPNPNPNALGTSNTTYHPPSAHASRPTPSPQLQPQSMNLSPIPPPSQSWRHHVQAPASPQDTLSAEERFPSLEDLDRTYGAPSDKSPSLPSRPTERPPSRNGHMGGSTTGAGPQGLSVPGVKGRYDGVRSQQVTGTAMREARVAGNRQSTFLRNAEPMPTRMEDGQGRVQQSLPDRPSLSRKHRSSVSVKTTPQPHPDAFGMVSDATFASSPSLPPRPPPSQAATRAEPHDWLTGGDDDMGGPLGVRSTGLIPPQQSTRPILRDSPSKRASYIERSPIQIQKPLEAESVVPMPAPAAPTQLEREWNMALDRLDHIPAGKSERERRSAEGRKTAKEVKRRSKSPATNKAFITRNDISTAGLGLNIPSESGKESSSRRNTTPSPSGLTDNWSPLPSPRKSRSKQGSSSSSDGGPEDLNGYVPNGGADEKTREMGRVTTKDRRPLPSPNGASSPANAPPAEGQRRRRTRSKGRQNSVHDLVDLWGGSRSPTLPVQGKRSSVIVSSSNMMPPPVAIKQRSSSPQPIPSPVPTGPPPSQPSPSKHGKQPSVSSSRRLPIPPSTSSPAPEASGGRSRPASMFIAPVSALKFTPGEAVGTTSSTEAALFAQQGLSPPADAPRSGKSARRSSISDMVQRYEAIGGGPRTKGQGPGPGPPAKPAGLSLKTHQNVSSPTDMAFTSPSAAASRFPQLSPSTSPVLTKTNLAVPEDTGRSQFGREFAKQRTSPTGLPPRSSPVGRLETPYSSSFNPTPTDSGAINGLPSRRSPMERPREHQPSRAPTQGPDLGPPPSPRIERKVSAQLEVENPHGNVRSPSPEKPYQGVSRLIDMWQRAADDKNSGMGGARRGGVPTRRAGMVSGGSGRG